MNKVSYPKVGRLATHHDVNLFNNNAKNLTYVIRLLNAIFFNVEKISSNIKKDNVQRWKCNQRGN